MAPPAILLLFQVKEICGADVHDGLNVILAISYCFK
jgi:hypothetical protein